MMAYGKLVTCPKGGIVFRMKIPRRLIENDIYQDRGYAAVASKYHNVKTVVGGKRFDSKAEAARYQVLRLLEKAGEIKDLECQPVFRFPMGFSYRADFQYREDGWLVAEDVKGFSTAVFRLKARCFRHFFPTLDLRIVRLVRGRWLIESTPPCGARATKAKENQE